MLDQPALRIAPEALSRVAERLLFLEARYLDDKEWDAWAALYADDAEYWAPAWLDEYDTTSDPATQISFIYHTSRAQLEERIRRIELRKSITALPLPRTLHQVSNVAVSQDTDGALQVASAWTAHVYDPRTYRQHLLFGSYTHVLRGSGEDWRIARKKVVIMNDRIPTVIDFYSI